LHFGTFAMFGFALVVLAAAVQASQGATPSRPLLVIIAAVYVTFGLAAFFLRRGNAHSLGYVLMGVLIGLAAALPGSPGSSRRGPLLYRRLLRRLRINRAAAGGVLVGGGDMRRLEAPGIAFTLASSSPTPRPAPRWGSALPRGRWALLAIVAWLGALPALAAITKVRDLGTAFSVVPGTSLSVTVPSPGVAAGDRIVIAFVMDLATGAVSASDTRGNAYSVDADVASSLGLGVRRTLILSANASTALVAGDTITVSFGLISVLKAMVVTEFSGIAPAGALDRTSTRSNSLPDVSPTSGFTVATSQADELLFGAIGVLQPLASGFTPGPSYTALPRAGTSTGGATDITIDPEFRIVSAVGSYEANGTLAASALWSSAIATYLAVLPPPSAAVGVPTLSGAPLLVLLLALAACGVWFAMKR
jgi:hypothetical protein